MLDVWWTVSFLQFLLEIRRASRTPVWRRTEAAILGFGWGFWALGENTSVLKSVDAHCGGTICAIYVLTHFAALINFNHTHVYIYVYHLLSAFWRI